MWYFSVWTGVSGGLFSIVVLCVTTDLHSTEYSSCFHPTRHSVPSDISQVCIWFHIRYHILIFSAPSGIVVPYVGAVQAPPRDFPEEDDGDRAPHVGTTTLIWVISDLVQGQGISLVPKCWIRWPRAARRGQYIWPRYFCRRAAIDDLSVPQEGHVDSMSVHQAV